MAEEVVVTGVRFVTSVKFNQTENTLLLIARDKCVLTRVQHGIEARGEKGAVFVPYSNVAYLTLEAKKAEKP